jgi:hypothetical protein
MLADGEQLSRLWRYVFAQLLDDYTSVLHHAGVQAAARMWSEAPRRTGDSRVDAAAAWEAVTAAPGLPACRCEKPAQGTAAQKTGTPGSAAVVEGHLVAVRVRERESAAERPVDGR